ncbi:MAG: UDP-N-acetylmuramoyl-L-alanyl-D-glutamate--2,6-diaminopimelate ligase [Pelagibacterales bacterium]|nr:UDP-N-acetylmuramoyl-L-alanyl-D-glutamate--2,6-diaminopimelate ligase [Pelagibacterales bacterium]
MNFNQIISKIKIPYEVVYGASFIDEILFEDIALDSRLVKEKTAFFAIKGKTLDGNLFINDSIKKGATIVVSSDLNFLSNFSSKLVDEKVLLIFSQEIHNLLIEFLQNLYSNLPSNIYAVTGTNGKTSVAEFCRQIFTIAGKKAASIGTLGITCDYLDQTQIQQTALTTPDIVSFYKNLFLLKKSGIDNVAVEVSSIGLEQNRIGNVEISVGAFTNFTQDHLDYHKTMEEYFDCKMILFRSVLQKNSTAVINSDIKEYDKISEICKKRDLKVITYGCKATSEKSLRIKNIEQTFEGQKVIFNFLGEEYNFNLSISGDFQAYNAICALAIFLSKNICSKKQLEEILQNFHKLHAAMGRMQIAGVLPNKAQVFIDFAHSPDALSNVLQLARKITNKKVFVLFGCGGNRDNKKRAIMGKVASELADIVIVTDDNPRLEDAEKIRTEILQGCDLKKTFEISDRKVAITEAISMLQSSDILILAGKGHEKYQIIGTEKVEFDEEKIVKNVVARIS